MRIIHAVFIFSLLILSACTKKPAGFGLEDSPIRYQTAAFEDADQLAEAHGQKFTKSQILDKSPVLKDLDQQETETLIGLAYLKVVEKLGALKPLGLAEVFLPPSKADLAQLLQRFDRQPTPGLGIVYKPARDANLILQYKDIQITRDDIDFNHVVLQGIEQRRYREIASQLNSQVARILVNDQAMAKKQDLQSFLQREVYGGKEVTVSEEELQSYLASIGFAKQELTDELRPRFTDSLKQRKQQELIEKYVVANILKGPIKVSFTEPKANLKLNENWRPVAGYKDAPIALVAFSGATCPDCVTFIANLRDILKEYDGHLKLNWIHNFNENDGVAKMMAEASLCVDAIRPGKAVEFMNAFAKNSGTVDERDFYKWAQGNKVDADRLKACFTDKKNDELVSQHLDYARRVGVVANPTLWIEGRTVQGVISHEQLEKLVKNSINTEGSSWLQAYWRRLKSMFTDS